MLPKRNFLKAVQETEKKLGGVRNRVRRLRLEHEWDFIRAAGTVSDFLALRDFAGLLNGCGIPFLVMNGLACALEIFHFFRLSPVSPLLTGFRLEHALASGISVRPWEILVPRHFQDRLNSILLRRGLSGRNGTREHPEALLHSMHAGYGDDLSDGGRYDLLNGNTVCRISFSPLFSLTELCEAGTGSGISCADAAAAVIGGGWSPPPFHIVEETVSRETYTAIRSQKPDRLCSFLRAASGCPNGTGGEQVAEHGAGFVRRCMGLLESGEGLFLYRDQLTDVLSYVGAIRPDRLAAMHAALESGQDCPREREEFLAGAVHSGMSRGEAASIWNTLTRNACTLPDRFDGLAGKLLLWRALVLSSRHEQLFRELCRSILFL